jgi:hypothetical protein
LYGHSTHWMQSQQRSFQSTQMLHNASSYPQCPSHFC